MVVSTLLFSLASVGETILEDRVSEAPLSALLVLTFVRFIVFEAMAEVGVGTSPTPLFIVALALASPSIGACSACARARTQFPWYPIQMSVMVSHCRALPSCSSVRVSCATTQ